MNNVKTKTQASVFLNKELDYEKLAQGNLNGLCHLCWDCPNVRGSLYCSVCGPRAEGHSVKSKKRPAETESSQLAEIGESTITRCKVLGCQFDVFRNELCSRHQPLTPLDFDQESEEIASTENKCKICNSVIRNSNNLSGICSKHYIAQRNTYPTCARQNCRKKLRHRTKLFCFEHDRHKQREKKVPRFLKGIDDLSEMVFADTNRLER